MVRVRAVGDGDTIECFDSAGNAFARFRVDDPGATRDASRAPFPISVEQAFEVATDRLVIDRTPTIVLRDPQGHPQTVADRGGTTHFQGDPSVIELCLTLKIYVLVDGAVRIECSDGRTHIAAGSEPIRIGVRAPNHTPTGEMVTTSAIEDVFAAVSAFGGAVPTFEPSRAFPRERAHPPTVSFGESFRLPEGLSAPDTGITIDAPPTYLHGAMAAPLAYFLGAELRPANEGHILVEGVRRYTLGSGTAFGEACSRALRRCVMGETILAAERWYDMRPAARSTLDAELTVDWSSLAETDLASRVEEYLGWPGATVNPLLPGPFQRVFVAPTEAMVASLPYLAYDLASVRPPAVAATTPRTTPVPDGGVERSSRDGAGAMRRRVMDTDPRAIGQDVPLGQHPAFPQAFRNRLERDSGGSSISIRIVCNDARMHRELDDVRARYAARADSPIDVEVVRDVTPADLRDLLARPTDYLHYIGHIDPDGFVCADGHLDAESIETTAVELFFLNSCESAGQAVGLVEAGACGGIATHYRVRNSNAVKVGSAIAQALTRGFPMGMALAIARYAQPPGDRYTIVGDPKTDLTATESGIPYTCRVRETDAGRFIVAVETHLTTSVGPGSLCSFHISDDVPYFIHPTQQTFEVDRDDLLRFLELEEVPVWMDGECYWSEACIDAIRGQCESS